MKQQLQENKMGIINIMGMVEVVYAYGVACGQAVGEAGLIRILSQMV